MPTALQIVAQELRNLAAQQQHISYCIPSLWQQPLSAPQILTLQNPAEYYSKIVQDILVQPFGSKERRQLRQHRDEWLKEARLYCLLLRHTTAFDHDGDGSIALRLNAHGWRETGSFLKTIVLLPYLHSLGINTLYMLPVTAIGKAYRKGNLGSPYAIRHPYHLDEQLAEPILNLSVEQQFAALTEACHRSGMRVITEFALRTASRDSDWALQHPDWFYWIRTDDAQKQNDTIDSFTPPFFDSHTLNIIHQKVEAEDFSNLPVPDERYRHRFVTAPVQCNRSADGSIQAMNEEGIPCTLPGAFADYPPDDTQPLWSDVTYLRLHKHPDFNYMAYNTLRMYDTQLEAEQWRTTELWDAVSGIIPYYKKNFAIDGAVLDMSHALPDALRSSIILRAREADTPNTMDDAFVLIEENFRISAQSQQLGFDAVVGDTWQLEQTPHGVQELLERVYKEVPPIRYFATAETHNTPRLASRASAQQAAMLFFLNRHLPHALPLILSGSELGETIPINTGLGFNEEELQRYTAEILPLFSSAAMNWLPDDEHLLRFLQNMAKQNVQSRESTAEEH